MIRSADGPAGSGKRGTKRDCGRFDPHRARRSPGPLPRPPERAKAGAPRSPRRARPAASSTRCAKGSSRRWPSARPSSSGRSSTGGSPRRSPTSRSRARRPRADGSTSSPRSAARWRTSSSDSATSVVDGREVETTALQLRRAQLPPGPPGPLAPSVALPQRRRSAADGDLALPGPRHGDAAAADLHGLARTRVPARHARRDAHADLPPDRGAGDRPRHHAWATSRARSST